MPLDSRSQRADQNLCLDEDKLQSPKLEDALAASYDYFWNVGEGHFLYREGSGSLHVRSFIEDRNKALLVILPGRGESSLKYAELAYELRGQGHDIVILDHRGQGLSERSNGVSDHIHIENFDDYVLDLEVVREYFCKEKKYKTKHILAHSMGGAIALRHIQLYGKEQWSGILLSSPMLKIKSKTIPLFIGIWILKTYIKLGKKLNPIWNKQVQDTKKNYKDNNVTHCIHRFGWARKMDELHPHIISGAPTFQWLKESIVAGQRVMRDKSAYKCPMLLIQADQDTIVCNEAQNKFAHEVENCRIIRLKECRHEILQESNSIRNRALVQITQFLKNLN